MKHTNRKGMNRKRMCEVENSLSCRKLVEFPFLAGALNWNGHRNRDTQQRKTFGRWPSIMPLNKNEQL